MRSKTDAIACTCERKDSLMQQLQAAAWSPIHLDVCFWMSVLMPFPDWAMRCRGAHPPPVPCAMSPGGAALFSGGHKSLVGMWWGQEPQVPGDPKPVWQARAVGDLSWGLWVQVSRHDTLCLFHAKYWRARHMAAFDHYPLWMKARAMT